MPYGGFRHPTLDSYSVLERLWKPDSVHLACAGDFFEPRVKPLAYFSDEQES